MKPKSKSRIYDSMQAAAAGMGLDIEVIRSAKHSGCPAFRSNRVSEDVLQDWLDENPTAEGHDLEVHSGIHGCAILGELFNESGFKFWLSAWAVTNLTLGKILSEPKASLPAGYPKEFLGACMDAVSALRTLSELTPTVIDSLKAAAIEGDPAGWLALTENDQGRRHLLELAGRAHKKAADAKTKGPNA